MRYTQRRRAGGYRRVLKLALLGAALAVLGAAAAVVAAQWGQIREASAAGFPLRVLKVESAFRHVPAAQVADLLRPYVMEGFFRTDVAAIKRALQDMPWVSFASVRRVWPDTLQVALVEQIAVARWGKDGLVNAEGGLFFPAAEEIPLGLPLLHGPLQSEGMAVRRFFEMSGIVAPLGLGIAELDIDERRSWSLTLSNGTQVLLGRSPDDRRLAGFVRFYSRALGAKARVIATADLRYPNGFAVRWGLPQVSEAPRRGARHGEAV